MGLSPNECGKTTEWAAEGLGLAELNLVTHDIGTRRVYSVAQIHALRFKSSFCRSLKEGPVPQKELVLIASRAISLYLVFWSLGNLANVPALAFAISHYAGLPASAGQDYLYKLQLIQLLSHIVVSTGLFLAAVWTYRCGPKLEAYLSPSEN